MSQPNKSSVLILQPITMKLLACLAAASLFLLSASVGLANEIDLQQASKLVVEKTNEFRAEHDLDPVKIDKTLQKTAQKFADFMARTEKYGHQADGKTPAERAEAAGYDYCVIRENIAYRSDTDDFDAAFLGEHFTQAWIESPEHRENMLADYAAQTGVAMATADKTTFYAVQLFGRPKSMAYRLKVTNETESTWTLRIASNGASDEIEIGPGSFVRTERCLPVTLRLVDTKAKQKLTDSAELTIRDGEDGPSFEQAEK